jgi:hypothetical protein
MVISPVGVAMKVVVVVGCRGFVRWKLHKVMLFQLVLVMAAGLMVLEVPSKQHPLLPAAM